MLNNAFQVVKRQKKFTGRVAENFVNAFIKQIAKFVEVVKVRKEKQKTISFQLPTPLNKPKLWSFLNKNETNRKMIGIKIAVEGETNKLPGNYKVAKEF